MSMGPKKLLPQKAKPLRPSKSERVYCRDCRYYVVYDSAVSILGESIKRCEAPANLCDTWYAPNIACLLRPEERNAHNDCPLFEPRDKRQLTPTNRPFGCP